MFPKTLAIIEDSPEYADLWAQHLQEQGVEVTVFRDSDDFLLAEGAFDFDFYLVDLTLPGVDGLDLVRLLRRRVQVGIVVISGRLGAEAFSAALSVGADMYLAKPAGLDQLAAVVKAAHRRSAGVINTAAWQLNRRSRSLLTPKKVRIDLCASDFTILQCFAEAGGGTVSHVELYQQMGRQRTGDGDNWSHAAIYRLRRRIESATDETVPLASQAGDGYAFRGRLIAV